MAMKMLLSSPSLTVCPCAHITVLGHLACGEKHDKLAATASVFIVDWEWPLSQAIRVQRAAANVEHMISCHSTVHCVGSEICKR